MSLLVPATVLTVVGINEADRVANHQPPVMKPIIAGFILGIGLYSIEGMDEQLGKLFCILLIVGSLLVKGATLFATIGGILK